MSDSQASFASRAFGMLYAVVCYVLFLGAFTLFAAAVSGLWRPWESSQAASIGVALAWNFGLVLLFAVQHTIMARRGFKEKFTKLVPAHIERSTFVLLSSLILVAIVQFYKAVPGQMWQVEGSGRGVLLGVVGLGYLGVVASSFAIDHFHLFGLQQAWRHYGGKPAQDPFFREPWIYKKMRHPMMLAVLVMMWAAPSMSATQASMAAFFTLYIFVGTEFEERELIAEHGDSYSSYRERVPRLFPRPW